METCGLVSVILLDCSQSCSGLDVSRLLLELAQANLHRVVDIPGHLNEELRHLVDVVVQFPQGSDRAHQDVVDCFLYVYFVSLTPGIVRAQLSVMGSGAYQVKCRVG